ncbi:MAG: hypothetical protein ACI93P_001443 [bacterium]|jgi:hypothetical protein
MKNSYTILNCEGDILQLHIEEGLWKPRLTFRAKMNSGVGCVYFLISVNQLFEFFNSKVTLSQIVQNPIEDRFRYVWHDKESIVRKPCVVLQCGDTLYADIPNDMKMRIRDLARLLSENLLCMDAAIPR